MRMKSKGPYPCDFCDLKASASQRCSSTDKVCMTSMAGTLIQSTVCTIVTAVNILMQEHRRENHADVLRAKSTIKTELIQHDD